MIRIGVEAPIKGLFKAVKRWVDVHEPTYHYSSPTLSFRRNERFSPEEAQYHAAPNIVVVAAISQTILIEIFLRWIPQAKAVVAEVADSVPIDVPRGEVLELAIAGAPIAADHVPIVALLVAREQTIAALREADTRLAHAHEARLQPAVTAAAISRERISVIALLAAAALDGSVSAGHGVAHTESTRTLIVDRAEIRVVTRAAIQLELIGGALGPRAVAELLEITDARNSSTRAAHVEVIWRAVVIQPIAELDQITYPRGRAAGGAALCVCRAGGSRAVANLRKIAFTRGGAAEIFGSKAILRALVVRAIAELGDITRANHGSAFPSALDVGRTPRAKPIAELGRIANSGGATAEISRGEAICRAIVVRATAELHHIAYARGRAAG